jgi:hypothetical protein
MKFSHVGTELFHAGGQTDMKKVVAAFRNYEKAPTASNVRIIQQAM